MTNKKQIFLIADDEPLIRDILSDILDSKGCLVETVNNGYEALNYYCSNQDKIKLIISDMNMPKMTGLDLIKELRNRKWDVPIIILTNNNEIETAIDALNNGANDYLMKDENIESTLLLSIRNVLEKQRLKEENRELMADLALKNSKLERFNITLEKTIRKLTQIGTNLGSEKKLGNILKLIVSEARDITDADNGTLYLMENDYLHCKVVQSKTMDIFLEETLNYCPLPIIDPDFAKYCASTKKIINITDIMQAKHFPFLKPEMLEFLKHYKPKSLLLVPMLDRENDVIGVLQLMNALNPRTGEIIGFKADRIAIIMSLASQAAVAITNVWLYKESESMFESIVEILATALDEKSPVTHGHVSKVVSLSIALAEGLNECEQGEYKNINFSEDELNEIKIASLLHDVGKITTPEYVVEKSTKLKTIFDRVHLITLRYDWIASELKAEHLEKRVKFLRDAISSEEIEKSDLLLEKKLIEIANDISFIQEINIPEEYMAQDKLEKLKEIASKKVTIRGKDIPFLSEDEFINLSVRKGSITKKELKIMRNHASITHKMLNKLPFTKKLKNVPVFASGHHERLDGSGYPLGLKGDQIPLQTRIIALIDLFEALISVDRSYKKAIPLEEALTIIEQSVRKKHIDAGLFRFFKNSRIYENFLDFDAKKKRLK